MTHSESARKVCRFRPRPTQKPELVVKWLTACPCCGQEGKELPGIIGPDYRCENAHCDVRTFRRRVNISNPA